MLMLLCFSSMFINIMYSLSTLSWHRNYFLYLSIASPMISLLCKGVLNIHDETGSTTLIEYCYLCLFKFLICLFLFCIFAWQYEHTRFIQVSWIDPTISFGSCCLRSGAYTMWYLHPTRFARCWGTINCFIWLVRDRWGIILSSGGLLEYINAFVGSAA